MTKYQSKFIVIEAVQWRASIESAIEIERMGCKFIVDPSNPDFLFIETLEGVMRASPWDWIIKGTEGEFYPCKDSVFQRKYQEVL